MELRSTKALYLATEIIVLSAVTIFENKVTIKNKIRVMEQVHDCGGIGHAQEPNRLISLPVEVLIPGVQRR